MNTTIQDVAKKANVSVATVSRVMNGNYPVKAETRENVIKAIKELNYIPNMQARELTTKKSNTIGVVVPSINNMFFTEVINGIESHIKANHLSLILMCTNAEADEEKNCINNLIARNVSGIIILSPLIINIENGYYDKISKKLPIVFVNSYSNTPNISCISNDEFNGAVTALNYLEKHNHKDILFVRGSDSYSYDIKEKAYVKFMQERNLFKKENIIHIGNGNSTDTVDNTMNIFLKLLINFNFTAILTCNDLMAVGIINACKRLNINIPKDLSIIGYDNILLSRFIEPKLTTMDQNMFNLGECSAKLLIDKTNSKLNTSKNIVLNNVLIERDTVTYI